MENKKKILYIITLPDWGGAQRYVFDLACYKTDKAIFGVTVAAGIHAGFSKFNLLEKIKERKECDVAAHQFSNLTRSINPIRDLFAIWEIRKYFKKEGPDIVHLNSSKAGILGSFAAIKLKNKPKIYYTVHGWVFLEPMSALKKWLYIRLEKLAGRWRDKIIVLGEREKQIAINYKICVPEKLEIEYRQLLLTKSFKERAESRQNLALPQDKKIIGTIANFYPAKGLEYLMEAASKINNPDVIFAVIGDGPLRQNYELLITNYKLHNKFLLLGEIENAAQYLKAFDLFVLPSVKEGAPYVISEAAAAGLPIIATDVGSVAEMLKDYNYPDKTIIPPANVEALTKAILETII